MNEINDFIKRQESINVEQSKLYHDIESFLIKAVSNTANKEIILKEDDVNDDVRFIIYGRHGEIELIFTGIKLIDNKLHLCGYDFEDDDYEKSLLNPYCYFDQSTLIDIAESLNL